MMTARLRAWVQAPGGCVRTPGAAPTCFAAFVAVWVALAVAPRYRFDWLLENLPTFAAVPALVVAYFRGVRFSDRAYLQGTAFLLLHTVGSHYTYSEVPAGEWLREALGGRNHYDRFVHAAFGLLMVRPFVEASFRRGRGAFTARELALACGVVAWWASFYEIAEWVVAVIVDPQAGAAFLGTQGDAWDAQKDLALGIAGGVVAAVVEWRLSRRTSLPP